MRPPQMPGSGDTSPTPVKMARWLQNLVSSFLKMFQEFLPFSLSFPSEGQDLVQASSHLLLAKLL